MLCDYTNHSSSLYDQNITLRSSECKSERDTKFNAHIFNEEQKMKVCDLNDIIVLKSILLSG
jgi:hypothetical protein